MENEEFVGIPHMEHLPYSDYERTSLIESDYIPGQVVPGISTLQCPKCGRINQGLDHEGTTTCFCGLYMLREGDLLHFRSLEPFRPVGNLATNLSKSMITVKLKPQARNAMIKYLDDRGIKTGYSEFIFSAIEALEKAEKAPQKKWFQFWKK